MNDRGGNGAGCFDIKEWADTTELTNVEVAELGKCSYLVGKRKDEVQIASRVRGAERTVLYLFLASCCLSPMRINSVLEELRVSRLAV